MPITLFFGAAGIVRAQPFPQQLCNKPKLEIFDILMLEEGYWQIGKTPVGLEQPIVVHL